MKLMAMQITDAVAAYQEQGLAATGAMMQPSSAKQLAAELSSLVEVNQLDTPYGPVKIMTSPHCPPQTIYIGSAEELQSMADEIAAMYEFTDMGKNNA